MTIYHAEHQVRGRQENYIGIQRFEIALGMPIANGMPAARALQAKGFAFLVLKRSGKEAVLT
jgi:hypothetical protein